MPATTNTEPEWFTADDLATRLKTTRRTILRWVAEKRIPTPQKFGKLARWSAEVVATIDSKGIGRPLDQGDELNRLPPTGVKVVCPCCSAELLVKRDGTAQALSAPAVPEPSTVKMPARKGKKT